MRHWIIGYSCMLLYIASLTNIYFSCSPLSIALCNGASKREYKAYWHMNFMGVVPAKIISVVILSFEVALVSLPSIIILL